MTASTRQVFLVVRAPEEPPLKAAEVRSALLQIRTRSEIEVREIPVVEAARPDRIGGRYRCGCGANIALTDAIAPSCPHCGALVPKEEGCCG